MSQKTREQDINDSTLEEPLNSTGHPAYFSDQHNKWLEDVYGWEEGSVLALYQSSSELRARARGIINYAISQIEPPDYEEYAEDRLLERAPPPPEYVQHGAHPRRQSNFSGDRYTPASKEQGILQTAIPEFWDLSDRRSNSQRQKPGVNVERQRATGHCQSTQIRADQNALVDVSDTHQERATQVQHEVVFESNNHGSTTSGAMGRAVQDGPSPTQGITSTKTESTTKLIIEAHL